MFRDDILLRTKLTPPRLKRRTLQRPMLNAKLHEAFEHRLTLVQAGTGYGKSTTLASLATSAGLEVPLFWYTANESDADPQIFLSYLIAAFRARLPALSDAPLAVLHEISSEGRSDSWSLVADALINALTESIKEPSLLVIDDYHFVAHSPEVVALAERFISFVPPDLHVIISARTLINSQGLIAWRAKGDVLEITRDDLAFNDSEIESLFRETYAMNLSDDEIKSLAHKTEGWPIALQLVWQGLRNTDQRAADLLSQETASLNALFDYLAHDVLGRQPKHIADFLRDTSVLNELTPAACDAVTLSSNSDHTLTHLHELDLFVVALGDKHYRYHHLFHDFLRAQLHHDQNAERERHHRAAKFFQAQNDLEEAIYHYLQADSFADAATVIEIAGDAAVRGGRLDTVSRWVDRIPPDVLNDHPLLQLYLADVHRLSSRFDEALAWYAQAEQRWRARGDHAGTSRALRGQALIYLDTVRPAQAESLLEEALRLSDGSADHQSQARLLELLAENKLNMGKPVEAESLREQARELREEAPSEDALSVRVKLRTGQLDAAQKILESWIDAERKEEHHAPRAHRETVLLLSLIQSFRGQAAQALAFAQEGVTIGERSKSPFVTAVAHIRLGHAQQICDRANDHAIRFYQEAIALGDRLAVRRIRAEAQWGLTRAYGFFGDLDSARAAAAEGIEIANWAGDLWIRSLTELMLGASHVLSGDAASAVEILSRVLLSFRECGDSFGRAATRLWLSLAHFDLKQSEHFVSSVDDLLTLCETHNYHFLFTASTLLGPPDPRKLIPILIEARARRRRPSYVARLLTDIGLPDVQMHPGYQLRVNTLGNFRVWRGDVEIDTREWKRDKARQLFQLLLTRHGKPLQREEITEKLWPALSPEAAQRDFKVALNALNKVLEPNREADAPFAYIIRQGTSYFIRPDADIAIDANQFERECETGLRLLENESNLQSLISSLQSAMRLYIGDFLPDALYEDWASVERERLLALYLRAADKLAGVLIDGAQYDEGLEVCQKILARDVCWERAYRLMMTAYAKQGNRPQALKTYQRCVEILKSELDVSPSSATISLHEQIARGEKDPSGF